MQLCCINFTKTLDIRGLVTYDASGLTTVQGATVAKAIVLYGELKKPRTIILVLLRLSAYYWWQLRAPSHTQDKWTIAALVTSPTAHTHKQIQDNVFVKKPGSLPAGSATRPYSQKLHARTGNNQTSAIFVLVLPLFTP